jgi:hypothetical protein
LRGTGVALTLPFLDAMIPNGFGQLAKAAAAQAAKHPVRLAWLFFPNGVVLEDWQIAEAGRNFSFNNTNKALEAVKDDIVMISNLAQDRAGKDGGDAAGAHARGASSFLTASSAKKTNGKDIYIGISADQVAAQHLGEQSRLPSIELGVEEGKQEGRCDNGYSCAYLSNISWRSPTQPSGLEINPRRAFDRLFGIPGQEAEAFKRRSAKRSSVLDFVAEDAKSLTRTVGATDRKKLDEYFTSVRELELTIDRIASLPPVDIDPKYRPPADPESVIHHMRLMYDVIALAFQTDTTRIITNMLADGQTNRVYEHLGITSGHHQLTHSNGKDAEIQKIDQFMTEEYARFIAKMKSIPEGDGSLLDNCLIMFGSGLGDGRKHIHHQLPCVVAGKGGGVIETGRHLVADEKTPIANLYLSMLQTAGCEVNSFGDSTGPLDGLAG